MAKLCIVSYYHLKDSLKSAADALSRLGYSVTHYPLFQYAYDVHDRVPDIKSHIAEFFSREQPGIILWWFIGVSPDVLNAAKMASPDSYWMLFNWDDPWGWQDPSSQLAEKSKYFDLVVATCSDSIKKYVANGARRAIYSPPGVDTQVYKPDRDWGTTELPPDDYFDCDVSFCCTNLYDDPAYNDQYYPRKRLVDELEASDIRFHLYGPEYFRQLYPRSYRGLSSYTETNRVFNRSRIVLSTHVCQHGTGYVNERTVMAMASGALIMMDPVEGLSRVLGDGGVLYLWSTDPVKYIRCVLADYGRYAHLRRDVSLRAQNFSWDAWAKLIHDNIPENSRKIVYIPPKIPRAITSQKDMGVLPAEWLELALTFDSIRNNHDNAKNRQWQKINNLAEKRPQLDVNEALSRYLALTN